LGTGGFVHGAGEGLELGADFEFGNQMESCGQDGGFQHGVLGSIKAEEVSSATGMDDGRFELGAIG
jgi:hypothetical protein